MEKPPIKTEVSGGTVALLGKVDSLAQKRIAEFAAAGVRGVSEVDNQITVRMSSDRRRCCRGCSRQQLTCGRSRTVRQN
ncbi:BON domain-containing protein [Rhodopirellula bahusiensis]|uniref:BON domain-containing protein n=1 Tax=Rhodopirellula bahusiensis TaxID=2014065 RepID=UPI0032661D99